MAIAFVVNEEQVAPSSVRMRIPDLRSARCSPSATLAFALRRRFTQLNSYAASWLHPEVLSPSRVSYTSPSRITKGQSTSHGTPREARNISSPVAKIESSVFATPTWAQRSRPIRRTVTRFYQSQCESSFAIHHEAVRVFSSPPLLTPSIEFSAHDNTKFVSSGGDRSVFVWDVTTGNTIRRISAHLTKINVVEFNNDASVVASGKSLHFGCSCRWSHLSNLQSYRFL